MTVSLIYSRAHVGIDAPLVTVETHISPGIPRFNIVGLPETTVKESRDRVRSALLSSHFQFPLQRITVNLGPADLPKEGGRFDLPIALSILAASKQISTKLLLTTECIGELALDGALRAFKGALSCTLAAMAAKRTLILPEANVHEASLVSQATILPAPHLISVCRYLNGMASLNPMQPTSVTVHPKLRHDFQDIVGQTHAKRAFEIAASGQLNVLMIGPPGTGKSLLASCLPGILPPLTEEEAFIVAKIYSAAGKFSLDQFWQRPFREPHHTCSAIAIVGGGCTPRVGEITLAHHGVLFLDELPEFDRRVLESLRTPLEVGKIFIARANYQLELPAKFQLIAAMNPCPCAYLGDEEIACRCTENQIQKYQAKISGPLLDRFDIFVNLKRIKNLFHPQGNLMRETSSQIRERIINMQQFLQKKLGQENSLLPWSTYSLQNLLQLCALDTPTEQLLNQAIEKFKFSPRACHRLLRVARTIANLEQSTAVKKHHLVEAISYRQLRQVG